MNMLCKAVIAKVRGGLQRQAVTFKAQSCEHGRFSSLARVSTGPHANKWLQKWQPVCRKPSPNPAADNFVISPRAVSQTVQDMIF